MHVSSQASRNCLEQRREPKCYFLEPGALGVHVSSARGLEYAYDGFLQSFSPGPSLDVICSGEITNSLSVQGRYTLHSEPCIKWGCRA